MQRNTEHFHSGGSERPMRNLLLQLPLLTARPGEAIQYEEEMLSSWCKSLKTLKWP